MPVVPPSPTAAKTSLPLDSAYFTASSRAGSAVVVDMEMLTTFASESAARRIAAAQDDAPGASSRGTLIGRILAPGAIPDSPSPPAACPYRR